MNPKEKYEDRNDLGVFDDFEYMDDDHDECDDWPEWDDTDPDYSDLISEKGIFG